MFVSTSKGTYNAIYIYTYNFNATYTTVYNCTVYSKGYCTHLQCNQCLIQIMYTMMIVCLYHAPIHRILPLLPYPILPYIALYPSTLPHSHQYLPKPYISNLKITIKNCIRITESFLYVQVFWL